MSDETDETLTAEQERWGVKVRERLRQGPIGLRPGDQMSEAGRQFLLRWRRGALAWNPQTFNVVAWCRPYLSLQVTGPDEALIHLSFENLCDEPIEGVFYFPEHPTYCKETVHIFRSLRHWYGNSDCTGFVGLKVLDEGGNDVSRQKEPGWSLLRRHGPFEAALEPREFATFTERVSRVQRDEGNVWCLPLADVRSGHTYRLQWVYMGIPTNTITWTPP